LKRYALKIEYIGKNYSGSQSQPNKNTIQDKLEIALYTLLKTKIKKIGRSKKKGKQK